MTGGFWVAYWQDANKNGYVQKYSLAGQALTSPLKFDDDLFAIARVPEIVESGPYHGALSLAWSVRPGSGGSDSTYYQLFDAGSGAALTDALLVSDTAYAEILSLASQDDGPTVVFNKPSGIEKSVINHVQQSPYTVTENADVSTVILDVNATDAENDTLQFSVSGTDTSLVTIDADSGRSPA